MTQTLTLFEQVGGLEPLTAVIDDFYDRIEADPLLTPFFAGANMSRLRVRQVEFLASALGGPVLYRGPSIEQVHAGRGIDDDAFGRVATHLAEALTAAGIDGPLHGDLMAAVASLKPQVISATA